GYDARGSAQSAESVPGADVIHPGCAALGRFLAPARAILPGTRPAQRLWTSAHCDSTKDLRDDAQDAALQHPLSMEGRGAVPEKAQGLDQEHWSDGGIEDFCLTGIIVVIEADPLACVPKAGPTLRKTDART